MSIENNKPDKRQTLLVDMSCKRTGLIGYTHLPPQRLPMISSHPRYTSDVSTDPDKIQWTQKRTWLNWSSSIILELYLSITSGWTSWKDDDLLYMTPSVLIGSIFNRRVLVPRNDPARFYSMHVCET